MEGGRERRGRGGAASGGGRRRRGGRRTGGRRKEGGRSARAPGRQGARAGRACWPAAVHLLGAAMLGSFGVLASGWAIPTATDIAFSYLIGRLVFGAGHPAVMFLLLLAITDDAGGLLILAVFYPQGALVPAWLLLSFGAALAAYLLANRLPRALDSRHGDGRHTALARRLGFWPYLFAGCLSWYGFQQAGIPPGARAVAASSRRSRTPTPSSACLSEAEVGQPDLLNRIEHALKAPVEVILFFFGLANAGSNSRRSARPPGSCWPGSSSASRSGSR